MVNTRLEYLEFNNLNFFEIKQEIGSFFVCKMKPKDLKYISKKDINRYESLDEIQRDLRKGRMEEIKDFIYKKEYATFPNSFIISVSDDAIYEDGLLKIPFREDEAYLLDGQHRLAGFNNNEEDFEIIVSVYIGLSKFYQAMIFANINGEQVKVNKSLVRSLYGFSENRTPEMVTYTIIKLLNEQTESPLKGLIKMLGKGDGMLSLSTFFDELIKHINPKDNGIFSQYYTNDGEKFKFNENDSIIYYLLEDYYRFVKLEFNDEWNNPDYILNKTTGFYAFFWIFIDIVEMQMNEGKNIGEIDTTFFYNSINGMKNKINSLTNDNYKAGGVGQKALYNDLRHGIEYLNN